jgi:hypothetical protein
MQRSRTGANREDHGFAQLYGKLLVIKATNAAGDVIERERRTTANHAMKTCRRAWNVSDRRNPGKLPIKNPFAAMGLESSDRETPTATFDELQAFRAKAIEMGFPSLATAALIAWEWLQREVDFFATFEVAHYRAEGASERCCETCSHRGPILLADLNRRCHSFDEPS